MRTQKTNKEDFHRDLSNKGSIVNKNVAGLHAYKKRKQQSQEIKQLKQEVDELKGLVHQLLEKIDKK